MATREPAGLRAEADASTLNLRRRTLLVGGASTALGWIATGCGSGPDAQSDAGSEDTGGATTEGATSSSTTGPGTTGNDPAESSTTVAETGSTSGDGSSSESGESGSSSTGPGRCEMEGWLAGGTASMAGDYPDPFDDPPDPTCSSTAAQTCGPCHAAAPVRKDITTGMPGLPMRLSFRVLYEGSCDPAAGIDVDVWFSNVEGVYSGEGIARYCYNGDAAAASLDFMRGRQTTNEEGKVDFDAIFPGWYPSRTTHVHVLFIVGGTAHYVTQFYFEDDFAAPIYQSHPDYDHRPTPDTTNADDGYFDAEEPHFLATRKTHDCALQAWATVFIPVNGVGVDC